MESAAKEAKRLGVQFRTGSSEGRVSELLVEDGDVKGAKTADGTSHYAARTILCTGANTPQIIDMKGQLRPTAWTLSTLTAPLISFSIASEESARNVQIDSSNSEL